MVSKLKDTFTLDELAAFFDLPSQADMDESTWEYVAESGHEAESAARAEHERYEEGPFSEADADKARMEGEFAAQNELYSKWHGGIERAADELFGNLKLKLVPVGKEYKVGRSRYYGRFKVVPETSWEDAAEAVRVVIDGIGYAHVGYDLQEFLELGPWTARQAVLEHLRTAATGYPEVYGSSGAQRIYEQSW